MRVLRVPCTDPAAADRAADRLRSVHRIDVDGVDGRYVLVPAGHSPIFVWDLAEVVQVGGFADDSEIASWATDATTSAA